MTKTILAVDDSQTIRQAIEWTFRASDFSVVTADSGQTALAQLGLSAPDLVLLDVSLPDQDGYQVARSIHAQQPAVPIVLLTSQFSAFDEGHARASGVAAHIGKPFDTQALIDLVESQIEAARAAPPPPPQTAAPPPPDVELEPAPFAAGAEAAEPDSISLDLATPAEDGGLPAFETAAPPAPPPASTEALGWDSGPAGSPPQTGMGLSESMGPTLEPPPPPSARADAPPVDMWALSDGDDAEEIEDIDIEDVPEEDVLEAAPSMAGAGPTPLRVAPEPPPPSAPPPAPDAAPPSPAPASPAPAVAAMPGLAEAVADRAGAELPPGLSKEELLQVAREVVERVAWEVVPELAEAVIREELARLTAEE
jgi:CheY-like chemotaxis protein